MVQQARCRLEASAAFAPSLHSSAGNNGPRIRYTNSNTISEFRSLRGQLNRINHTRTDISFAVAYLSLVTEVSLCEADVKPAKKVVKNLSEMRNMTLRFVPPDLKAMYIVVYTDSSFANNKDCASQIGFFVFPKDDENNANLIHFSSRKAQRGTTSILGAEIYAFADGGLDYEFILQHHLTNILKKNLLIRMITDSKSIFDNVTKMSYTEEKRLAIDVSAIREAYDWGEIDKIAWIRSFYNPADAMAKLTNNAILLRALKDNQVEHTIENLTVSARSYEECFGKSEQNPGPKKNAEDDAKGGDDIAVSVDDDDDMKNVDGRLMLMCDEEM